MQRGGDGPIEWLQGRANRQQKWLTDVDWTSVSRR
jgi:hypothetical protein